MIERQIDSPMPIPSGFVVKKASKIWSHHRRVKPRARIRDRNQDIARPVRLRAYPQQPRPLRCRAHRLDPVDDQIQDNLLQLATDLQRLI
jgi:hypothetical protein